MFMRLVMLCIIPFIWLFFTPAIVFSEIIVHDTISIRGEVTMLCVEIRGTILRRGGELVEFIVNGKSIGHTLSGGDGYAYKQFVPLKIGLYNITAKSGNELNNGTLLSLKKGTRIVLVDLEHGLFEGFFSKKPRKGSQEILKRISKKFPIILLQTSFLSINAVKTWLKKNGFQNMPLIKWDEGFFFNETIEKGLKIRAVIGSKKIIESVEKYKPIAFSFEDIEDAIEVNNWEEIEKKLLKSG